MHQKLLSVVALSCLLFLSACAKGEEAAAAGSTSADAATPAADAASAALTTTTPDYPQPVFVIPPKPAPGAPHGPGFDMPLIETGGYTPSRPMDILRDAHMFTADHPEVSSYVPCYCGCGNAGHKNNSDCFVRARDAQGRVTEWEPHGVSCAVCIDIAVDSMRMRNSGASVSAIRTKVQNDYRPNFPNSETPTPAPPPGK